MTTVTKTFNFTGAVQTYNVPLSVTSVVIVCKGASGSAFSAFGGGTGATVTGTLAVTGGSSLNVYVGGGGGGSNFSVAGAGGFNGGAQGGATAGQSGSAAGSGGGGASDVRQGGTALANRKIMAAGGGGTTANVSGGAGGALGGNGSAGSGSNGGGGGTQSAGGAGGGVGGGAGASGQGGNGSGNTVGNGPGGGGGGFFGGGGGGFASGGVNPAAGGGGSSNAAGCTSTSSTAGTSGGNPFTGPTNDGFVTISYTNTAPTAPTLTSPANYGYLDVENANVFWTFNDPDTGDIQGAADVRYRVNGGPWTTFLNAAAAIDNTFELPNLTVGLQYEWQVRTYDFLGEVSPWSSSQFFIAVDHPTPVGFSSPIAGQAITDLTTQGINWIHTLRNQNGYTVTRYGALADGTIDTSTVYETTTLASSSANSRFFTDANIHRNGREWWAIRIFTHNNSASSDLYTFPVTMSYDAPQAPLCVAAAQLSVAAIQIIEQMTDLSVDYFAQLAVPTVADTGQALTNFGSPAMNGTVSNGLLFNNTTVFGQVANVAAKILSMQCTFQFHDVNTTHANSISMLAGDTGNTNAYIFCTSTRSTWAISKLVAGATTQLATGSYATLLPGPAVPLTMSASIVGTTITFVDPLGISHTATDAIIGSQTGTFARISIDNTGTTTPDKLQLAHWSASDTANVPVFATLDRSTDGTNFQPIPGAEWDSGDYGAIFAYIDYAPPVNVRTYYRVTAYTAAGAIARSAVT